MTETQPPSESLHRLLNGNRAMVPLAVVGVLLLLSSVMFVGYMETRADPEPTVDATLAVEMTESAMQSTVRDATQRATKAAATQPLTAPADTEWGDVLNESGRGDPFENYLRALIYLEVKSDLGLAGQHRGDIETNVTVPAVDDASELEEAIERVSLHSEKTNLTVTLDNLTITATHRDDVIDEYETSVEVTVATPIMQLHDRVEQYQYAIDDAEITERGFTQRFNARTYAIGWARGWAQNYRAPVAEVLANRHVEPSANAALYRTQQDVFGDADPNLRDATRLGWTCMALKDGEAMFDEYMSDRDGMEYAGLSYDDETREFAYNESYTVEVPEGAADRLCSSVHLTLDQYIEQHPQSPDVMELIGGTDLMQETETLEVGDTAYVPLVEMADPDYQYSFANAIQNVFTIEGSVTADTTDDTLSLDVSCDPGYTPGAISRDSSTGVVTTEREEIGYENERYYQYDSEISVDVTAERTCYELNGNGTKEQTDSDDYAIEVTTVVGEKETAPGAMIGGVNPLSEVDPEYEYSPGPDEWGLFNNYDGAEEEVTEVILGGVSRASHEQWLEHQLKKTDYERNVPSEDAFETTQRVALDYDLLLLGGFKLKAEMADDIATLQEATAAVELEFERHELVSDNPVSQLRDELEAQVKEKYIDEPATHEYENVGEKALYEARYMYYLTVLEHLETLEDAHDSGVGELEDRVSSVDDSLGDATEFLTQGIREEESEPDAFESPTLTDNVSYEVSGSPTYLVSEDTVTSERIPPVEHDTEFAPLRTKNTNFVDMPYDEVITGMVERALEIVPFLSANPDAEITFRMAGDVLAAAELATAAQKEAENQERKDTYLDGQQLDENDIDEFRANVDHAIDAFETNLTKQIVATLYPAPEAACVVYDQSFEHDRYPGWDDCHDIDEGLKALVEQATDSIESAVEETLESYDPATTALKIGDGNATEYIVENVTHALEDSQYYNHDEFAGEYHSDQWEELINSAVRPAVSTASAISVTVGNATAAEELDTAIQGALGNATEDLVESRVEDVSEQIGTRVGEKWAGNTERTQHRAARIPAGLPLLPVPGKWVATVNAWDVEVAGEYARFEATANMGTPADATELTYVRENTTVAREIAGSHRELGSVEEIAFDARTVLLVVTPPGVGVGDRDDENPECSPTYPHLGEVDPETAKGCDHPAIED